MVRSIGKLCGWDTRKLRCSKQDLYSNDCGAWMLLNMLRHASSVNLERCAQIDDFRATIMKRVEGGKSGLNYFKILLIFHSFLLCRYRVQDQEATWWRDRGQWPTIIQTHPQRVLEVSFKHNLFHILRISCFLSIEENSRYRKITKIQKIKN